MKEQFNQYLEKYKYCNFEISLASNYDDDILEGIINFFDYNYNNNEEIKSDFASIEFFILNAYDLDNIVWLADHISSDLVYVASAYREYCNDIGGMGSVAIIDEFDLIDKSQNFEEKVQSIKFFLSKTIEKLQIIGTGTLLFMSKALILDLEASDRILLINELLDFNIIPIYQDSTDVVLARNLDYII